MIAAALLAIVIGQGAATRTSEAPLPSPPAPPATAEVEATPADSAPAAVEVETGRLSLVSPRTLADAPTTRFGSFAAAMSGVLTGVVVTATAAGLYGGGGPTIVPTDAFKAARFGGGIAVAILFANIGDYMNGDERRFLRRLGVRSGLLAVAVLTHVAASALDPRGSGAFFILGVLLESAITTGLFVWSFVDAIQCRSAPNRWVERGISLPPR